MPLEILRGDIASRTAQLKFPKREVASRTFYVVVSLSMAHLRDWFQRWFPASSEELKKILPWIVFPSTGGTDDVVGAVSSAWLNAYSAATINALTAEGNKVSDTATQVILIADLTEDGIQEKLETVYQAFEQIMENVTTHKSPVVFSGLFLARNIECSANGSLGIKTSKDLKGLEGWMTRRIAKAFLFDISNPCGTIVSNANDLHFCLGQLLYILSKKPVEFAMAGDHQGFSEWATRGTARDRQCTGFSGISILSPIDQIMETLLLAKGGEVLQEAFFGGFSEERAGFYLKSLMNKMHLNSTDVFRSSMTRNPGFPLIDPFAAVTQEARTWDIDAAGHFIALVDGLDVRLQGDAQENRKTMDSLGKKSLDEFRYVLLEHLNQAVAGERGGLLVAGQMLSRLRETVAGMITGKPAVPVYPDVSSTIRRLESKSSVAPRRPAIVARTLMLTLALLGGFYGSQNLLDLPFIAFPLLALLGVSGGVVYWFASKAPLEKLVVDIWGNLHEKWTRLLDKETGEVVQEVLPKYMEIIDELLARVTEATSRLQEVVQFYRETYAAPVGENSAFWVYSLSSREEMLKYMPLLKVDVHAAAADYLAAEKPLELWNRVSAPGSTEPNEWEWRLGEGVGRFLLPSSDDLLNLSICRILRDAPEKLRRFEELLRRSADPYLNVVPGTPDCVKQGALETPQEGCEDIVTSLSSGLKGNYQHLHLTDSLTPYRISCFSFAEDVEMANLKLGS
ncbi:MAG: hypothetical protein M0024_05510 [Nitrospiraceae bacterium]|nr:hypothetical protein [Nitrospiraceae bacterium]